jgi:hypothetical protein
VNFVTIGPTTYRIMTVRFAERNTLNLVLIAWAYVVMMMALAEAVSPNGTVLNALFTLLLYGALPLWILLYIMGTPARREARRRREAAEQVSIADPDAGGEPTGDAVAPERKVP